MTLVQLGGRDAAAACTCPEGTCTRLARPRRRWVPLLAALLALAAASVGSLFIGAATLTPEILVTSRLPRLAAILLSGSAMAAVGMLMQLLVRNRFVEPGTVGTTESAGAGLLAMTILAPAAPVWVKMLAAVAAALAGTWVFLRIIRRIPAGGAVVTVPLVGIMLSGIVSAATMFVAFRFDLQQTIAMWLTGDFSGVVQGRFEMLWLVAVGAVIAYLWADRFTVLALGESHARNLGLDPEAVRRVGLVVVAVVSAICTVTVGGLPFLGLVVPNLVSRALGDNLRRSLPWVAIGGAAFVLVADVLARTINHPYEVPVGIVVGLAGSAVFLVLLLRSKSL